MAQNILLSFVKDTFCWIEHFRLTAAVWLFCSCFQTLQKIFKKISLYCFLACTVSDKTLLSLSPILHESFFLWYFKIVFLHTGFQEFDSDVSWWDLSLSYLRYVDLSTCVGLSNSDNIAVILQRFLLLLLFSPLVLGF